MISNWLVISSILFGAIPNSFATFYWGNCPDMDIMRNFNFKKFQGAWYVQDMVFPMIPQSRQECVKYTFRETIEGGMAAIESGTYDGFTRAPDLVAYVHNINSRFLNVFELYHQKGFQTTGRSGLYHILSTDYYNYALMWKCTNYKLFRIERTWIFSRFKYPQSLFYRKINKLLKRFHINIGTFRRLNWDRCQ